MLHLLSKGGENRFQSKDDLLLFILSLVQIFQIGSIMMMAMKKAEQHFKRVI